MRNANTRRNIHFNELATTLFNRSGYDQSVLCIRCAMHVPIQMQMGAKYVSVQKFQHLNGGRHIYDYQSFDFDFN